MPTLHRNRRMKTTDSRLLELSDSDNVLVALTCLRAGDTVHLQGGPVCLSTPVALAHKLASRPIAAGEKIVKYGACIGTATRNIAAGEHVHVHNVASDYTPTYHLIRTGGTPGDDA